MQIIEIHPQADFDLVPFSPKQTASDFVERMWRARQMLCLDWPAFQPISLATYQSIAGSLAERVNKSLFEQTGERGRNALFAWRTMVYQTIEANMLDRRQLALWTPDRTFDLFNDAFECGLISQVTWSAAVRICYLDWVAREQTSGERVRRFIEPLSQADPRGLMTGSEQEHVDALPDVVTLYRTALTQSFQETASGISWTNQRSYLEKHMEHTLDVAKENRNREATYSTKSGWHTKGRCHWAVEAQFPRSAIRAWIEPHGHEYLVDYRHALPGSVRPLSIHQPYPTAAAIDAAERYVASLQQD